MAHRGVAALLLASFFEHLLGPEVAVGFRGGRSLVAVGGAASADERHGIHHGVHRGAPLRRACAPALCAVARRGFLQRRGLLLTRETAQRGPVWPTAGGRCVLLAVGRGEGI